MGGGFEPDTSWEPLVRHVAVGGVGVERVYAIPVRFALTGVGLCRGIR